MHYYTQILRRSFLENKKTNYKLVIFDLDGTLMNTAPGIFATANWTMKQLGKPIETDVQQLRKFVGPPLTECFKVTYDLEDELIDEACKIYRMKYEESGKHIATVYDGMEDVLQSLNDNDLICSIATNKYQEVARDMVEEQELEKYFNLVYGSDHAGTITKGGIISKIIDELNIDPKDAVMVGDTFSDLNGASEAGVDFIAVTYGFGFNNDSELTDDIVSFCPTTKDILDIIYK